MFIKRAFIFFAFLQFLVSVASANNISYVLAARQADLFKTQDRISDMVANVNTTAFKAESDIYSELNKRVSSGEDIGFSNISTTKRNDSQGAFISTKRQLDIAIDGVGYFMVQTPRGNRFTRAGNLKATAEGVLTTKDGYPVLGGGGGQVELAPEDVNITIRETGLVTVGVEERGQISVFTFADNSKLIKEGKALYRTDQVPVVAENASIVQGMLEASNVNSVTSMTDLIAVARSIERVKAMQEDWHGMQINLIKTMARQ